MLFGPVETLSSDDQIEYVNGLMVHSGPPPVEGLEKQYGKEEVEAKSSLKQLKKELDDLESKQKLVEEKLIMMQKEKPADSVKSEDTIKAPLKGDEQSIFRRDFKIQLVVGVRGQKDKLANQALFAQIDVGLSKGYEDK